MRNKIELLRHHITTTGFDIFTFPESWLNSMIRNSLIHMEGYNLVRMDRTWKTPATRIVKTGGGVGAYLKNNVTYSVTEYEQFNYSSNLIECMWLKIINTKQKRLVIGVVYRPPNGNVKLFCQKLAEISNEIRASSKAEIIIIIGDFNINYIAKESYEMKQLKYFETMTGLKQLISENTRYRNCIDLAYADSSHISQAGTLDVNVSDHSVIFLTRKKSKVPCQKIQFEGRSYRNYNCEEFQETLNNLDWSDFYKLGNPELCWDEIMEKIETEISKTYPIKKRTIKSKGDPWMTSEIIEIIHDKDYAWNIAKKSDLKEDWNLAKKLRNYTKSIIHRAKADFIQDNTEGKGNNPKKFWKKINTLLRSHKSNGMVNLVNKETDQPLSPEDTPNFINNFFVNVGSNLAKNFSEDWSYDGKEAEVYMEEIKTNELEIEKLCKEINITKASSVPNLSSRILKDAFLSLTSQLTYMYNLSFRKMTFPDKWKMANIIPLQKTGDTTDVNNLRPVSLLPLPGKIAERIIHTRMYSFLEMKNVFISLICLKRSDFIFSVKNGNE